MIPLFFNYALIVISPLFHIPLQFTVGYSIKRPSPTTIAKQQGFLHPLLLNNTVNKLLTILSSLTTMVKKAIIALGADSLIAEMNLACIKHFHPFFLWTSYHPFATLSAFSKPSSSSFFSAMPYSMAARQPLQLFSILSISNSLSIILMLRTQSNTTKDTIFSISSNFQ